jgi:hypothetical protein
MPEEPVRLLSLTRRRADLIFVCTLSVALSVALKLGATGVFMAIGLFVYPPLLIAHLAVHIYAACSTPYVSDRMSKWAFRSDGALVIAMLLQFDASDDGAWITATRLLGQLRLIDKGAMLSDSWATPAILLSIGMLAVVVASWIPLLGAASRSRRGLDGCR